MTTATSSSRPSTTSTAPTTTSGRTTTVRTRLAAGALAAGGVLIVAGHALSIDPDLPASTYLERFGAHHTQGVLGGLTVAVGALLLLPGLAAALSLVCDRGRALATAGAVLAGCGAAALGAGDVMITLVLGALVPDHDDLAHQLLDIANGDDAPLLGLPFTFAPLLVLGLVLVGAGLIRSRGVPVREGALLIVGSAMVFLSAGGGVVAAALPLAPLGLALVLIGLRAARA